MRDRQPRPDSPTDPLAGPAAEELSAAIAGLGDRATPAPEWPDLLARHRAGRPRSAGRWPVARPWPVVAAVAVSLAVVAGGLGWVLAQRGDDGTVDLDTVDRTSDGVPDGPDGTGPPPTAADDGSTPGPATVPGDPSSLVLGPSQCLAGEPERFAGANLVGIPADLDGDGRADTVGAVSAGDGPPTVWVSLADGSWVLTEVSSGERPPIEPGSAWAVDLGGGPADELVVHVPGGFTLDRVEIYRLGDCAVEAVPTGSGQPAVFPVAAHSSACQDVCNVGLVCVPGQGVLATETSPVDPADPRGDHTTAEGRWDLRGGALVEVSTQRGTVPWEQAVERGFANRVSCDEAPPVPDPTDADQLHEALRAVAQLLGARVVVAEAGPAGEPGERGIVVIDGDVIDLDPDGYRVVGFDGDALATAPTGSFVADGPRLDLAGRPIDCPALPGWSGRELDGTPVDLGGGAWAVEVDGPVADQPLDLPGLADGPWWPITRVRVDCVTGQRTDRPPVVGAPRADGTRSGDDETFLEIVSRPGRTIHLSGGEGVLVVTTDDGRSIDVPGTTTAWAVTADGTGLVRFDLDADTVERIDIDSGQRRWSTPLDPVVETVGLFEIVGDRIVVSDPFMGATLALDLETGGTAVEPLPHPGLALTGVR